MEHQLQEFLYEKHPTVPLKRRKCDSTCIWDTESLLDWRRQQHVKSTVESHIQLYDEARVIIVDKKGRKMSSHEIDGVITPSAWADEPFWTFSQKT